MQRDHQIKPRRRIRNQSNHRTFSRHKLLALRTPTEYLQNILFIIITNQGLNLKNIYIDYIPEPVEHNKSSPTTINVNIYSLEVTIDKTKLDNLKMKLDEALNKFSI